ncbi:hypothetical protein [Streptomyces sp. NPDC005573]|uniref:hypothetical protein n=1 Tax=unclassified Streptomyces TaxID=2593676 RepID=UPI0033B5248B
MPLSGTQKTRLWLAGASSLVAVVGLLFATDTIGGDRNECSNHAVCGHDNNTTIGDRQPGSGDGRNAAQERKK